MEWLQRMHLLFFRNAQKIHIDVTITTVAQINELNHNNQL